ncbi:MAG: DUF4157 domain-containing protein [Sphingomonas sp.]|jgi:hypothetical protein|uniref:eCIS core domain-containing protein n=1 Tax=Sphingomonas sp. TaxID=28214 RepID=UPI003565CCA7
MAESARQAKAEETRSTVRATQPARVTLARSALDGSRSTLLSKRTIQPSLRVSQPSDAAEVEADRVARAVVSMPAPAPDATHRSAPMLHRAAAPTAKKGTKAAAGADPDVEKEVRKAATGGAALPPKVRKTLEPRFRASFAGVRIHTDGNAAKLSAKLGARAFTFGNHIFFGGGAYDPNSKGGMELLAHELTHTIQQGETIQRKADPAADTQVTQRTERQASRLGLSDALNFFADAANAIPGFRMFTILIGVNPINMSAVEASAANILRAIVEFLPGGNVITRVLDSYGIFDKVGGWIEGQLKSLGISGASIKAAIDKFLESLSWKDIFNLSGVWERAKSIFTDPISKIISFAKSLFSEILRMVREAVLRPLAALAEGSAGYPLLKVVIGFDPVTGEAVQPTAEAVIGGLLTLVGQDELWANIQRAKAIPRAWAWFKGAMGGIKALVSSIPSRFIAALKGLEIMDFVVLPSAFIKLAKVFGNFMGDFGSWALGTVIDLLKIIVEVVAPGAMPYIAKAGAAFNKILKNPVGFVQTLVNAGKLGFRQFASNFLTHLKASLVGWLTGAMSGAGVYIPQGFSLREILKFVLSVLGLTWANIRAKLVKATSETVVVALETGFDIVKTLVTDGPAAAWQKILESLNNLKEMVIEQVMDFVKSKVVEAAVTKLLSMLSPAGALIQAIIAIYNTVMFFVERLQQIAAVAASFIDSLATIAAGNIGPAANRVEKTLAGLLTLVISFLARIAGLGKVSDAVLKLVAKVRAPIDKGLDKAVAWIVEQAKKLGKMLFGKDKKPVPPAKGDKPTDGELGKKVSFSAPDGGHKLWVDVKGGSADVMMASTPKKLTDHLKDFKKSAKDLEEPDKGKVLAAIGSATPIAKSIEKDAKVAAKKAIGTAERDALDDQIEAQEETLRPSLVTILDTLGAKVPDKMTLVPCMFMRGFKASHPDLNGEYTGQLKRQEAKINAWSVHIWMERRAQFAKFSAQPDADNLDDKARKAARKAIESALAERLTHPLIGSNLFPAVRRISGKAGMPGAQSMIEKIFEPYSDSTKRRGLGQATAEAEAKKAMEGQAVLHEPDKYAGGRYNKITDVGSNIVNGDIGANWAGMSPRAPVPGRQNHVVIIEGKIKDEMKKLKVARALWRRVGMLVRLDHN